ncbi:CaiB/BaiF CoA transferase family protein, partial [Thermodesulfobacteriota bacterium]
LGASVVKIEKPGGDAARRRGPFRENPPHPAESLSFLYNNTNKMGITLNLEHRLSREVFLKLAKIYDVVVETFPPGYLEELELGYAVLKKVNPKLILVSVTGFGQNGPRNNFKSCDLVASAFGGQMYTAGSPSKHPLKPYGHHSYHAASLFAAIAVLIARRKQVQSGKGEHIDISLQEAVTATLEHHMIQYFYEQIIPRRRGNLHWNNQFCILPCKDGFIHLTLFHQWETLVEWMDSEGMADDLGDKQWVDEAYRLKHIDHVIEVLQRWTKTHTTQELFELGQLMHFPWSPVFSPQAVLESPQHRARRFFVDTFHPEIGAAIKFPRLPYRFSSQAIDSGKRAPLIGEDNDKVYGQELGLTEKELESLSGQKVI